MANYINIVGCGNSTLGMAISLVSGGLGGDIASAVNVGDSFRIFSNPGYNPPGMPLGGCWVYQSLTTTSPLYPVVNGQLANSSPVIPYGTVDCQPCAASVMLAECGGEPTTVYYGNQFDPFDAGKIFRTSSELPPCVEVFNADLYEVEGLDTSWTYPNGPVAISPGVQVFESPTCAQCLATAKCVKLTDCVTGGLMFTYYLEDNISVPGFPLKVSALIGSIQQITIPVTMINEVTGLPEAIEFTSCFNIESSTRDPLGSPGCTIQNALVLGNTPAAAPCSDCNKCFNMVSCDNPIEVYQAYASMATIFSDPGGAIFEQIDLCGKIGKKSTIRIDILDGLGPRCFEISMPCTGVGNVLFLDLLVPLTYMLFCDDIPCINCVGGGPSGPIPTCYQVTFCETGQSYVLQDPISDASPIPIGNYYKGAVVFSGGALIIGCFTVEMVLCTGINPAPAPGAEIIFDDVTTGYIDCLTCNPPPAYKLSRCDDPGVYYIVNNDVVDVSFLSGKIIRNLELYNCSAGPTPCFIKPEQCWLVEQVDPEVTPISVASYDTRTSQIFAFSYPTMSGCECCNDTPYTPPTT